jgi:hypothetical protein
MSAEQIGIYVEVIFATLFWLFALIVFVGLISRLVKQILRMLKK